MKLRSFSIQLLLGVLVIVLAVSFSLTADRSDELTVTNQNQAVFAVLPRFEATGDFRNGLAPVKKGDQWGYIDRDGEWVLEPQYEAARSFGQSLAAVKTNDGWGFIRSDGEWQILPQYRYARSFAEGFAAVKTACSWSFIDRSGTPITSFRFDWVDDFHEQRAVVSTGKQKGFLKPNGELAFDTSYHDAGHYAGGWAPVRNDTGWGYIERGGRVTVPFQYDWASSLVNDRGRVLNNDQWAFVTKTDTSPVEVKGSFVSIPGKTGLIRFKEDGKIGFLDNKYDEAFASRYDQARSFNSELTPAQVQGLWGYINRDGDWLIEPKFNTATTFSNGLASVKINGKWGFIPDPRGGTLSRKQHSTTVWADTGLESVDPARLNNSLEAQFPTWRYRKRDRYVRVLSTSFNTWTREENVPESNFEKPNARYEVTRFPYDEPTALQIEASEQFFWRALNTALQQDWFRPRKAYRAGFGLDGKRGIDHHYFNEDYLLDKKLLTPNRTESLIYHESKNDVTTLSGMMFYHTQQDAGAPQIGGPLTAWHYHVFDEPVCHRGVLVQPFDSNCEDGTELTRSPEMIHTWFIDHPGGPFGTQTEINEDRIGSFKLVYDY